MYSFFWNDFCGWYLEVSKSRLSDEKAKATVLAVQDLCLRQTLLLLHPFMPFITEELWHSMGYGSKDNFIQNASPFFADEIENLGLNVDESAAAETEKLKDFVSKARALKAQCSLATRKDAKMSLIPSEPENVEILSRNIDKLKKLVGAESIETISDAPDAPAALTALGTVYLDVSGSVDTGAEIAKLEKEKAKLESVINSTKARLANESFVSKAPVKVIEGAKKQLDDCTSKLEEILKLLKTYQK